MKKLFDDGPAEPPTIESVRLLEGFGYKKEAVLKWERARANAVLAACQKEQGIALLRAVAKAREEGRQAGDAPPLGLPIPVLRLDAAAYIESCQSPHDLCQAISLSICNLTNAETTRLGGYLVRLLRANNGRPGEEPGMAPAETGRDRGGTAGQSEDGEDRPDPVERPGAASTVR